MSMMAALDMIVNLLSSDIVSSVGFVFGADTNSLSFGVAATKCTPQTCPGSFYTAIATAWANIGYLTHSDVLRFLHTTNFGKWAIILYIVAAITGLLGVATNSPMRNYTWFFIGPALYSFLVGTTMPVTGVNWVVANKAVPDMSEVWKNAETGLANTRLAKDGLIRINGREGPTSQYEVAMPMVFLDELFSATTNILIEWTGIGRQVAGTGRTNLTNPNGQAEGPWWIMSTLKWEYLESIVGATARNPDVRDALVTFLGSECGEKFKEGINSGAYIAATQARGASPVQSVMIGSGANDYLQFLSPLNTTSVPVVPRSLARLFKDGKRLTAVGEEGPMPGLYDPNQPNYIAPSFLNFSRSLLNASAKGRGHGIVCSEYLWTLVQALRFEAGQAYYQLTRSAPSGLDEKQFVSSLIYGWDVRKTPTDPIAPPDQQEAFIKHLILTYILRNELMFAPAITSVDQRFSPAAQARSYSDASIRSYGSKGKFIEIYNAAIMMPYLQGILAYFLIVAYPIACMLVILPGHYKGFITWVSFFAWIKLWDVGFAMVQVIERSVWAMVGNHTHLASTANVLIETATKVGGIGVTNPVGSGQGNGFGVLAPGELAAQGAVPIVCSLKALNGECSMSTPGEDQTIAQAAQLLDKLLLTGANIDLDLSNGWYIYIMSALYVAVPTVTGQLVLGAKAGSAGLVKDAFQGAQNDGSQAAKTGAQHADANAITANANSLSQAAQMAAMNKSGLMNKALAARKDQMDLGLQAANLQNEAKAHSGLASQLGATAEGYEFARGKGEVALPNAGRYGIPGVGVTGGMLQGMASKGMLGKGQVAALGGAVGGKIAGATNAMNAMNPYAPIPGIGGGGRGGAGGSEPQDSAMMGDYKYGAAVTSVGLKQSAGIAGARAAGFSQNLEWDQTRLSKTGEGKGAYASNLSDLNRFDADSSAWEARNDFAAHISARAGIAGMNSGSLASTHKPHDGMGFAMDGSLGGDTRALAEYSGTGFLEAVNSSTAQGKSQLGGDYVTSGYQATGILDVHADSVAGRVNGDAFVNGALGGVQNHGDKLLSAIKDPIGTVQATASRGLKGHSAERVDNLMNTTPLAERGQANSTK